MGINIEMWRARIGTFSQPVKCKLTLHNLKLKHVSLCIRVLLFFLLAAQCVETNPGPDLRERSTRGRSSNRSSSQVSTAGRHNAETSDIDAGLSQLSQTDHLRQQPEVAGGAHTGNQPQISNWLHQGHMHRNTDSENSSHESSSHSPADLNIATLLLEIRNDVKCMNKKFDHLEQSVNELKRENIEIKEQNSKLSETVETLNDKLKVFEDKLNANTRQQEKQDILIRKSNLKFYGIDFTARESNTQTEEKLRTYISRNLEVNTENIHFDFVHRLPFKQTHPILAKFSSIEDRDTVLNAFRDKRKHGAVQGRVVEDLPDRVMKARTGLFPFMQECINSGKSAKLKHDKLLVDGDLYEFDFDAKKPVLVPQK